MAELARATSSGPVVHPCHAAPAVVANGLPPSVRRPSTPLTERVLAVADVPAWALAAAGVALVVLMVVIAMALLVNSDSTQEVLVAEPGKLAPADGTPIVATDVALPGMLRITGAHAGIYAEVDGVDRGELPMTMDSLEPGAHRVILHGGVLYEALEREVVIESGRTMLLAEVELKRRMASNTGQLPAAAPSDTTKVPPSSAPKEDKPDKGKVDSAKPKQPPKAKGRGTININSLPSAKAMLDGKMVGNTPVLGLSVAAGPHTVVLVHPKYGKAALSVNVPANKTAVASHRFPYKKKGKKKKRK